MEKISISDDSYQSSMVILGNSKVRIILRYQDIPGSWFISLEDGSTGSSHVENRRLCSNVLVLSHMLKKMPGDFVAAPLIDSSQGLGRDSFKNGDYGLFWLSEDELNGII